MPRYRGVSQKELSNLVTVGGRGCRRTTNDATPWNLGQSSIIERSCFVTPADSLSLVKGDADSTSIMDNDSDASSVFVSDDDCSFVSGSDSSQSSSSNVNSYNGTEFEDFDNQFGTRHGNRLVDYAALTSAVEEIAACKCCYKDQIEQEFESFLTFCDEKLAETVCHDQGRDNFNIRKWYTAWNMDRKFQPVPISVTDVNHGLATELSFTCDRCALLGKGKKGTWKNHCTTAQQSKEICNDTLTKSDICQYNINVRFCYALQLMGIGGEHAATLAAFLDLPDAHKWNRQVSILERFTHPTINKVRMYAEQMGTDEEINATLNSPDYPIDQELLEAEVPLHRVRASYDMGWQVRSSGNKYASPTGHGLLLGAITRKVMDSVTYNKKCATCTKSKDGKQKPHNCVKNYEGSSKSMEAAGLVQMLNRMPTEKHVSIATIVSDDDSNARSKAQHTNNGGQLTNTTEEPSFLADPSHRKRVFARAIYNLASAPVKVSRVSKGLAGHLKYCYGACVKRYRHLTVEELSKKVYNILEHICGNHEECDESWCYDVKAKKKNKQYNPPADHRIHKEDTTTYMQLKKVFDQYANLDQMAYCNHPYDTQTNEALNQSIATVAPKSTCYSGTVSLYSRIGLIIGIHNLGYTNMFRHIFQIHEMNMTRPLTQYLEKKEHRKGVKRKYERKLEVKLARSQKQKKSRQEVFNERTDKSYGAGVGLQAGIKSKQITRQQNKMSMNGDKRCKCGSTTHLRTTHKSCPLNKANNTAGATNEKNSVTAGGGLQKNNEAPADTGTLTNSATEVSTVLVTVTDCATPSSTVPADTTVVLVP
jgi:hypothetical protein